MECSKERTRTEIFMEIMLKTFELLKAKPSFQQKRNRRKFTEQEENASGNKNQTKSVAKRVTYNKNRRNLLSWIS